MQAWALIVGINAYPEGSNLRALNGAVADAMDFAEWALHPDGGAVAPDHLFFWTHPLPDPAAAGPLLAAWLQTPTPWPRPVGSGPGLVPPADRAPRTGEIAAVAERLGEAATLSDTPQRVYVLFAGHGVQLDLEARSETCFLAHDYVEGMGLTPCDQLRRALLTNGVAEVVMFLDCCRTSLSGRTPTPNVFKFGAGGQRLSGVGHAAEPGMQSFEFPEPAAARGAFTHALTETLRLRRDTTGALTFDDLRIHVRNRVPALLGPSRRQRPQFQGDPPDPDPPLVVARGAQIIVERDIVVTFASVPAGTLVELIGLDGAAIGEPLVAGPDPVRRRAPIGAVYALETQDHAVIRTFPHDGPGESHVEF